MFPIDEVPNGPILARILGCEAGSLPNQIIGTIPGS